MKKVLIVGQGIAGSCIARQLELMSIEHEVIDDRHSQASSMVAGGMWNPIVFRRLNKSWNIDELLPYALKFYRQLEEDLNIHFLKQHEIIRFFSKVEEMNDWMHKIDHPGYQAYMSDQSVEGIDKLPLNAYLGYGIVHQAGKINVQDFLVTYSNHLRDKGRLCSSRIDYKEFSMKETGVQYKNELYDHIIFCEGAQLENNPYFNYLPLQKSKGETLTIRAPKLEINHVLNKGFFVLDLGDHLFKIGATFDNHDHTMEPTEKAKSYLTEKLNFLTCDYDIVKHEVGIRPTVSDRRPLVGTHPVHQRLHILNGLGSKGVSICPLMANELALNILGKGKINTEADIVRFQKRFLLKKV